MAKGIGFSKYRVKPRIKHRGIHSKTKASIHKTSRNYLKRYNGQGR